MRHALTRRTVLATAGMALLAPAHRLAASEPKRVALELLTRDLTLRASAPPTPVWRFAPDGVLRLAQGDQAEVTIANRLPVEATIHWRGLDGAALLQPLLARPPIPAGGTATYALALVHAGTLICEAWLGPSHAALPLLPVIVVERAPVEADRDVIVLVEDWRLTSDGKLASPGPDAAGLQPIYTVNGQGALTIEAALNERLRLRLINGTQQSVFALQLSETNVRVAAIDGQPSEPFMAREGRLVMAPGTRIDAIVDFAGPGTHAISLNDGARNVSLGEIKVTGAPKRPQPLAAIKPLPSNGLPEQLALQSALRVDVPLEPRAPWSGFPAITSAVPPAFRVKRGRPVVLALSNPGDATAVFHLHGHHMRLLDRLDDGWKPFWLDTIAVPAKQTVRVAFAATNSGLYLMEMRGPTGGSPRMLRSYLVEM